jgi:hypothetical protein
MPYARSVSRAFWLSRVRYSTCVQLMFARLTSLVHGDQAFVVRNRGAGGSELEESRPSS